MEEEKLQLLNQSMEEIRNQIETFSGLDVQGVKLAGELVELEKQNLQFEELYEALEQLISSVKQEEKKENQLLKDEESVQKVLAQKQESYREVRSADTVLAGLRTEALRLTEWKRRQEELEVDFLKCETLEQDLLQAQKHYQKAEKEKEQYQTEYNRLEKLYLDAQAGLLAETLREGEACPVCGSCHHPDLAKKAETVPDKKLLDEKLGILTETKERAARFSGQAGDLKKQIEKSREEFLAQCCVLAKETTGEAERFSVLQHAQNFLAETGETLRQEQEENVRQQTRCQNDLEQKETLETEISKREEQLERRDSSR